MPRGLFLTLSLSVEDVPPEEEPPSSDPGGPGDLTKISESDFCKWTTKIVSLVESVVDSFDETVSNLPLTEKSFGALTDDGFVNDLKALSSAFCGSQGQPTTPVEEAPSEEVPEEPDSSSGSLLTRYCGELQRVRCYL